MLIDYGALVVAIAMVTAILFGGFRREGETVRWTIGFMVLLGISLLGPGIAQALQGDNDQGLIERGIRGIFFAKPASLGPCNDETLIAAESISAGEVIARFDTDSYRVEICRFAKDDYWYRGESTADPTFNIELPAEKLSDCSFVARNLGNISITVYEVNEDWLKSYTEDTVHVEEAVQSLDCP